jgi:asparagine synthase (glutamine-hydrolysing)
MFAAIIFDDYSGKIFAFRDNFGIKPLYLWRSPAGDVALGSEIKQFTVLDGWKAIVNEHLAYDFLVNGWLDHTDGTMFKGVTQLRGGHYIYCNLDEMVEYEKHVVKFSDNRKKCDLTGYDAEVLSGELYNHLNNAVISHLHADVPVGSCLSGGLDSSSIVALVERNIARGQVQKTFSAVSEHKIADESKYIDAFVSSLDKVHPYSIYPNVKDLFEELDDLVWHMDEPFGSTSIFAQRCVFKKARDEGIKVMLDGQGSDELFGGYDAFVVIRINELLKSKQYLRAIYEGLCTIKNKGIGPVKSLVWGRFFGRNYPVTEWLSIEDRYAHYTCAYGSVMGYSHDLLYSVCLPALLHYEDRNSSCFSIEARVPFLDRNLSNFAQGIPSELKVHNGWTKYILRDAMTGTLINKLRLRKDKMGFATPEEIWIRDNRDMFKSLFVDAINRSEGIIKHEAVRKFDRILDKREPFSFWIWRIIVLGAWMRVFDVHRET